LLGIQGHASVSTKEVETEEAESESVDAAFENRL
jgi:hypothetical protein